MIFTPPSCSSSTRRINPAKGVRNGRLFHCLGFCVHSSLRSGRRRFAAALLWAIVLLLAASPAPADDCALNHADATVSVSQVIDGDTVRLKDRHLLRFMSINTPEIDHEHHTAEPLADAARAALEELIGPMRQLQVQYGRQQRYDRHGRLLAHVFTATGVNIQQQLLQRGLGFWIAVPPNLALMSCYHAAEQQARAAKRGVWSLAYYQPRTTAQLGDKERGFRLITGVVKRVGQSRKSVWLNLRDDGVRVSRKSKVALRISRDDLHYFYKADFSKTDFAQWQGRQVTARGWMYPYKGQLIMRIKHPAALEWAQ